MKPRKLKKQDVVFIPMKAVERDILIVLPSGREITVQYRNYGDEGDAASVDILLPDTTPVYNWVGSDMEPARAVSKTDGCCRMADQLMFMVD